MNSERLRQLASRCRELLLVPLDVTIAKELREIADELQVVADEHGTRTHAERSYQDRLG